jgi:hypothetical protein
MMPVVIPKRSASRYAGQYAQCADPQRLLEIFSDSHRIALSSKNPETARTRFELALELYHQLLSLGLPADLRSSIQGAMCALVEQFPVQVCLNEAIGLCEKARKLKTARGRLEYLHRAEDVLRAGLATGSAGSPTMRSMHDQVRGEIAQAEAVTANKS